MISFADDRHLTRTGQRLKRVILALRIRRAQCTIAFDGIRPLRFYREQWVMPDNRFVWRNVLIINGHPRVWFGRRMTEAEGA